MSKKVVLIGLACILVAAGIIAVWKLDLFSDHEPSELAKEVEGDGIDIIVYGNLKNIDNITCRTIDSLSKESIRTDNRNQHHCLAIYDPEGNLPLGQTELSEVREMCLNEYLDMIYIGDAFSKFQEAGFFTSCEEDDPMGFNFGGYQYHLTGNPYTFNGEAWVDPAQPDTFHNNPFLGWFYSAGDTKKARKDAEDVWGWIYDFCLMSH